MTDFDPTEAEIAAQLAKLTAFVAQHSPDPTYDRRAADTWAMSIMWSEIGRDGQPDSAEVRKCRATYLAHLRWVSGETGTSAA